MTLKIFVNLKTTLKIFINLIITLKVFINFIGNIFYARKRNIIVSLYKGRSPYTVGCPIFLPFYIDSQISVHRKFKK